MYNKDIKSGIQITLKKETEKVLDSFSKERGFSRSSFIEDILLELSALKTDPLKAKSFLGNSLYEKYFKN